MHQSDAVIRFECERQKRALPILKHIPSETRTVLVCVCTFLRFSTERALQSTALLAQNVHSTANICSI